MTAYVGLCPYFRDLRFGKAQSADILPDETKVALMASQMPEEYARPTRYYRVKSTESDEIGGLTPLDGRCLDGRQLRYLDANLSALARLAANTHVELVSI